MKLTFLIALFFMFPFWVIAQNNSISKKPAKDTTQKIIIIWECIPKYDSLGNKITDRIIYRHIPTRQDTLDYKKECGDKIKDVTGLKDNINNPF